MVDHGEGCAAQAGGLSAGGGEGLAGAQAGGEVGVGGEQGCAGEDLCEPAGLVVGEAKGARGRANGGFEEVAGGVVGGGLAQVEQGASRSGASATLAQGGRETSSSLRAPSIVPSPGLALGGRARVMPVSRPSASRVTGRRTPLPARAPLS